MCFINILLILGKGKKSAQQGLFFCVDYYYDICYQIIESSREIHSGVFMFANGERYGITFTKII